MSCDDLHVFTFFNSKNLPLILYHIVACNEFSTVYRGINDISDSDSDSDSDFI